MTTVRPCRSKRTHQTSDDDHTDAMPLSDASSQPVKVAKGAAAGRRTLIDVSTKMAAQTFFTDGLHLIFSFLPLADISSSSVCRRWSSAVSSEPPRAVRCDVRSAEELRDLATSNLRRHVQTLNITQRDVDGDLCLLMAGDLPELICRRLPSVTHLLCAVDLHQLDHMQFPHTLRTLEVQIAYPQAADAEIGWHNLPVLLSCVARASLTTLRISTEWYDVSYPPAAMMEPLLKLRDTITELEFARPRGDDQWTADHFALFRSLPHLTRLDVSGGRWHEELELLTADPTTTHLQSIGNQIFVLSPRGLAAVSRLSSLTELLVSLQREPEFDLTCLSRLTSLETMHLMANQQSDATQITDALKQCTNITALMLQDVKQLTDAHLCALLPSLTRLRRVDLRLEDELDDLSCLSAASNLAGTLEHLRLEHRPLNRQAGPAVPHHALVHLRSLRRLQSADVRIATRRTDTDIRDITRSDPEAVFMPMMEDLRIHIFGEGDVDLGCMLGRLPQLSIAHLRCDSGVDVPPLLQFLNHRTPLTVLIWHHAALTDEHLCSLLPTLPHLRELQLSRPHLTSLRFAACSAHLTRTLETLEIVDQEMEHTLRVDEIAHLRSLGALRRLQLVLVMSPCHLPDATTTPQRLIATDADSDSGDASSLASLTSLDLLISTSYLDSLNAVDYIDLSLLGPMPQLKTCVLHLAPRVQPASIARALSQSAQLVDLQIIHPSITDEHLAQMMPHLTHLRSLDVQSQSHFGGLAFASSAVAPRLAATLTHLNIRTTNTTPMKSSDLHHLRALASLVCLFLNFPQSRASLAADLEEMSMYSPRFRCDCWPRLQDSVIICD